MIVFLLILFKIVHPGVSVDSDREAVVLNLIENNGLGIINHRENSSNISQRLINSSEVSGESFLSTMFGKVSNLIWPRHPPTWTRIQNPVHPNDTTLKRKENSRFLNLFSLISIPNTPCKSTRKPLRELNGSCYHPFDCAKQGGLGLGECADGFGVCCFFQIGCGARTNQNVTYLESPNFPTPYTDKLDCTVIVDLLPNVRQVLLEFVKLELRPPTTNGDCIDDQFVVSGHNLNHIVPVICGINNGQHMYVDVSNSEDRQLILSLVSNVPDNRIFSIRISQLSDNLAPQGCLQYYLEPSGSMQTFNYDLVFASLTLRRPQYFNNLNYAICIRRNLGYCTITYSNQKDGAEEQFQLLNVDEEGESVIPPRQAGAEIYNCPDDFVIINGLRLCGEKLNDGARSEDFSQNFPITDFTAGPIIVQVRTNSEVAGRGFKLHYNQNMC